MLLSLRINRSGQKKKVAPNDFQSETLEHEEHTREFEKSPRVGSNAGCLYLCASLSLSVCAALCAALCAAPPDPVHPRLCHSDTPPPLLYGTLDRFRSLLQKTCAEPPA